MSGPKKLFTRVCLESPYSGNRELNSKYLALCMYDCITKYQEAPFASHGLYTQCLDDNITSQRNLGIKAGLAWQGVTDKVVVYVDLGLSEGMILGIENAELFQLPVEYRKLNLTEEQIMNYTGFA